MKDAIVHWNVDPDIFWIGDSFPIRYYGLCWAIGLGLGYLAVKKIYLKENVPLEKLDQLTMYIFIGLLLGARLGHCLFYEPQYYLEHPLEIILPIKKIGGSYAFIGFQGLASHGGVLGAIMGILLYVKKYQVDLLWVLDRVAIGSAITAAFIRLGNLMNSEIYGKPTNGEWGFVFERVDQIPRHPTQLYEALSYLLIFGVLLLIYNSKRIENKRGLFVGLLLTLLFTARFCIEFFKENQVGFEDSMTLNMGQWLSIPFMLLGIAIMYWRKRFRAMTPGAK